MLELSNSVLPDGYTDTAVAIGKFDGIHLGHQQLFRELVHFSEEAGPGLQKRIWVAIKS